VKELGRWMEGQRC